MDKKKKRKRIILNRRDLGILRFCNEQYFISLTQAYFRHWLITYENINNYFHSIREITLENSDKDKEDVQKAINKYQKSKKDTSYKRLLALSKFDLLTRVPIPFNNEMVYKKEYLQKVRLNIAIIKLILAHFMQKDLLPKRLLLKHWV